MSQSTEMSGQDVKARAVDSPTHMMPMIFPSKSSDGREIHMADLISHFPGAGMKVSVVSFQAISVFLQFQERRPDFKISRVFTIQSHSLVRFKTRLRTDDKTLQVVV
jgi:hypothetical protein